MIVFGGYKRIGVYSDVWALSLDQPRTWSPIPTEGTPPPSLVSTAAIYDSVMDRMLVYCPGDPYGSFADTSIYALSLGEPARWERLSVSGIGPPSTWGCSAAIDGSRRRLYILGFDGDSEAWWIALDSPAVWTRVPAAGVVPPVRSRATLIHDTTRNRVVLYGGFTSYGVPSFSDVWVASLDDTLRWSQLAPDNAGRRRHHHVAVFDPAGDQMIVFGGYNDGVSLGSPTSVQAFGLGPDGAWQTVIPAAPGLTARYSPGAVFDCADSEMVIFGGGDGVLYTVETLSIPVGATPAWRWDPVIPEPVQWASAAYDPDRRRMLMFGGQALTENVIDRMYALDLNAAHPTWTRILVSGAAPLRRMGQSAVWDPLRHRMLLFGGVSGPRLNDLWEFSGDPPTWTSVLTSGIPPEPRDRCALAYDARRDRLILYGGQPDLSDLWELPLSGPYALTWRRLAPSGTSPDAHYEAFLLEDPSADRMFLLGGSYGSGNAARDPWVLEFGLGDGIWSKLVTPDPRQYFYTLAQMRVASGMPIVYGSLNKSGIYQLRLQPSAQWEPVAVSGAPPAFRRGETGTYAPDLDRLVLFGGYLFPFGAPSATWFGDTWVLDWAGVLAAEVPRALRELRLSVPRPNPTVRKTRVVVELQDGARATLDVFDIHGRRVRTKPIEAVAGSHEVDVDLQGLSPGLYYLRLMQARQMALQRIVVCR